MTGRSATASHAYLILAHAQFQTLEKLVGLLDHPRNDILIHVSARSKDFDPAPIERAAARSRVTFIPRQKASYEGFTVTQSILGLMSSALVRPHAYYHLLSGMDLPLRGPDEVLSFFDQQDQPLEYVHFSPDEELPAVRYRTSLYHPLQELIGAPSHPRVNLALRAVNRGVTGIQPLVGVDRLRRAGFEVKYGSTWFSITQELAEHVHSRQPWIKHTFRSTFCPDEHFLQTLVFNSEFRDRVASRPIRLIDFERGASGRPYVFRTSDLPELESSECLFARKFDTSVDAEVIEAVAAGVRAG